VSFSTLNEDSTIRFSALDHDETVLAVSGTAVVFSEAVTRSDGSRKTAYIHGNTTLTPTTIGRGTARVVQYVEVEPKTSTTASVPVSITEITGGSRIAAAAVTPTAMSTSTSTSSSSRPSAASSLGVFGMAMWATLLLCLS
jgi:hypothetical protein